MTVEQALLLAVEGVRLQDSRETRAGLLAALTRSPALIGSYHHDTGTSRGRANPVVAVRPDGEVLIASDGATTAVHDADTLDVVHTFDTPRASRRCTGPTASSSQCPPTRSRPAARTTSSSTRSRCVS